MNSLNLTIVLNTGFIPTEWSLDIISPLYKNRGDVNDPDNYRGITLLSGTGKLFIACLNYRLSCYVEYNILGQEHADFLVGYSTIDHIFVLHIIIEFYQSVKKPCIDYRKVFDFINRPLLWQTLLSYEFNGKLFNVVKHIYDKAKFSLNNDTLWSHYFVCNVGVRQGDNMSPSLFALFINDIFHYISQSYKGLNISRTCYPSLSNEYLVFYKLLVLLYADDTVILQA